MEGDMVMGIEDLEVTAVPCPDQPEGGVVKQLLTSLSVFASPFVRWRVAVNHQTDGEVLAVLATDSDPWVREAVARNPETPAEALRQLAHSPEPFVRLGVAANPHATSRVLAILATDDDSSVCWAALHHTNTLSRLAWS